MLKGVAETAPIDQISDYFAEMVRVCAAARVNDGDGRAHGAAGRVRLGG